MSAKEITSGSTMRAMMLSPDATFKSLRTLVEAAGKQLPKGSVVQVDLKIGGTTIKLQDRVSEVEIDLDDGEERSIPARDCMETVMLRDTGTSQVIAYFFIEENEYRGE